MIATATAYQLVFLVACYPVAAAGCWAEERDGTARPAKTANGLPSDWARTVEVPTVKDSSGETLLTGAVLRLSNEQGWLLVRRETPGGDLEWQVVLARADNSQPPEVQVDKSKGSFELMYGNYFIRENFGALRVFRERKTAGSPAWPRPTLDPKRTSKGWAGKEVKLSGWVNGDWWWAESGLPDGLSDVWVRLNHNELAGDGYGWNSRGRLAYMFHGLARIQDEGDLLVAERIVTDGLERALQVRKLRKEMGDKPAPALVVVDWFNTPAGLSLDKLHGKVVMIDFWGKWCGPCVKKLPQVEALHEKYKDHGLVVIGIHSVDDSEMVEEFLKEKGINFPIAIDSGETAKRYAIDKWPTYFLINKAGQVIWGFAMEPPSEAQVEELLRE